MILGVIEDLLEKLNSGNSEDIEDAKASLKSNKDQFIANLQSLVNAGNEDAKLILQKLKNIQI
jgi:hypothetical protein